MTDPLRRDDKDAKKPEEAKSADGRPSGSFLRGFHSAQVRKPIVEHEPGLGAMIFSGMLTAAPFLFMYWMYARSQVAASKLGQELGKKGGMLADFQKNFQKMMSGGVEQRNFRVEVRTTKFKDVIGVPEAVAEVRQYVDFLQDPNKFTRLGARLPKGCLLTGDPGTGKTLLAKAVAGESNVPFFTCSGADFIEVYSGSGPKRVRELFKEAKQAAPSVIFIDEIDAVGSRGGHNHSGGSGSSGEENRTVNQLLAEMDGLQASEQVVIFAATNHPDNIDKALLREGRFDRKIELPMPDIEARQDLFKFALDKIITGDPNGTLTPPKVEMKSTAEANAADQKAREQGGTSSAASTSTAQAGSQSNAEAASTTPAAMETALEGPVDPDPSVSNAALSKRLASLTPGVSPATVMAIVNEAALAAAVGNAKYVKLDHLLPAIDDVLVGKKHRSRMTPEAAARVALHEAGHTVVAWYLPHQSDVIKVSITPRGQAGGFTQQIGRERLDMQTDVALFTDICVMLGGRIAESTRHGNLTTGAYDDLQRATKTAVTKFLTLGMSARVGLLAFDHNRMDNGRMYQKCSEETQRQAEVEAQKLLTAAFRFTTALIRDKQAELHRVADLLVEKREVLQEDLEAILGKRNTDIASLDPRAREALSEFVKHAEDAGSKDTAAAAVKEHREQVLAGEVADGSGKNVNAQEDHGAGSRRAKQLPVDVDQAML